MLYLPISGCYCQQMHLVFLLTCHNFLTIQSQISSVVRWSIFSSHLWGVFAVISEILCSCGGTVLYNERGRNKEICVHYPGEGGDTPPHHPHKLPFFFASFHHKFSRVLQHTSIATSPSYFHQTLNVTISRAIALVQKIPLKAFKACIIHVIFMSFWIW